MEDEKKIKLAVNGGIGFGAKLNAKQLITLASYLGDGDELELTTFQQLYVEIPEANKDEVVQQLEAVGLSCYPVGNFVKSLRTCNFCKGELEEGMPVAKELNRRIAGREVPFTMKAAYTGCAVGCGEPMVNDLGVMKIKDHFNLYVGGKAKGKDAQVGVLLKEGLTPDELYACVDKVISIYAAEGKKRENFPKFIGRIGVEQLLARL